MRNFYLFFFLVINLSVSSSIPALPQSHLPDSRYSGRQGQPANEPQPEYEVFLKEDQLKADREAERQTLLLVSLVLTLALCVVGCVYYCSNQQANQELKKLNEEIRQQKEEIEAQAEVLQAANQLITAANESLEMAVQERTRQLEDVTHQILGYTFLNAHKVRGPLARVMGLTNLLKQNISPAEIPFIVHSLTKSAEELDQVIKELNEVLQLEEEIIFKDKISR